MIGASNTQLYGMCCERSSMKPGFSGDSGYFSQSLYR